ncbi:arginine--tRNA ligase [Desulfotomaculum copahuensis]|uniref:Arginine--tRNA ligase n=1 Tax=Desulfotomaculum copahuensis TaxID=1838280 RepID=A0A1B7LBE3_9FIRM|nr:arginine--tRNA ligase [Desulfotomaculum copahuensis]OAT79831.1 arginine--tRNA ligase [Desulfotomaculum copahuensis]
MSGIVETAREQLARALREAVAAAGRRGALPVVEPPDFVVEVPREKEHGDFATNLAMLLARPARTAPRKIAGALCDNINLTGLPVQRVEIAGPGFINFYLQPDWVLAALPEIEAAGDDYGRVDQGRGSRVQVEFVSANPTGLLHMGNARGAALGDSIAAILDFAGYHVSREYYINDAGNQIENFGLSLEARYFQLFGRAGEVPEQGYHGEDIVDTVRGFIRRHGERYLHTGPDERRRALVEYALAEKLTAIKTALAAFGVRYDVWFSEQSLHDSGAIRDTLRQLEERGYVYSSEGALWFKAREFGVEKDEVLVRASGIPTYYAADIAYHRDKFRRGFGRVINIWGADHHGHVPRMKAAVAALGYDPDALEIIIMQLVRLYRGGEIVRMSKRSGQFVTLEELVEEVGRDAARYFFVMRSADSHLDFDLDLARAQSNDNPVYYVQYAHARICSIFRQLAARGMTVPEAGKVDLSRLKEEAELALARKLADFPGEIDAAARDLAPHRLARYVHELAGLLHSFYNAYRVITDDAALTEARLVLVGATRTVLANGLRLLGLSAPEQM